MSNETVKPLFEDASASSELRNFVALARSDGPSQADLDRLSGRMAPILGLSAALVASSAAAIGSAPASATAAALAAPAAGATPALGLAASGAKTGLFSQLIASTTAKVLAVSLSAGAVGVGVWKAGGTEPHAPTQRTAVPRRAADLGSRAEPRASTTVVAPAKLPEQEQPAAEAQTAPVEVLDAPQPEPKPAFVVEAPRLERAASRSRAVHRQAARRQVADPVQTSPVKASVVEAPPPVPAPVEQVAPPSESEPVVAAPPPPPPSELSLIRRAQAMRDYDSEALALLAQHAQLYPRGALAQEREILAVELLIKAHRRGQAKERAAEFEDDYPRSAHLPRLRALLERAGIK